MAKKKPVELLVPDPIQNVNQWFILGLDPSLSRTGYAIMQVATAPVMKTPEEEELPPTTTAKWLDVGSVKPGSSSDPEWVRSKIMAAMLRNQLLSVSHSTRELDSKPGLIISMEYPTPTNTFLVQLNRIIHLIFFEPGFADKFASVRVLTTNAATLRSLMGLVMRGAKNKKENMERAYDFIDRATFPGLDTDSCDAVMLAMMGRHAASVMIGAGQEVPERYLKTLCDATRDTKGKGKNQRVITKGLFHRKEYWYEYRPTDYEVVVKDARTPAGKRLDKITYNV